MKLTAKFNILLLSGLLLFSALSLNAKTLEPESNYGIIGRIISAVLASEHIVYIEDDNKLSDGLFNEYIKALDPNHMYFTQKDIDKFQEICEHPYYQLKLGDTSFAFYVYNRFVEKVKMREEYAARVIAKGLDFSKDDDFEFDRTKAKWAADEAELDKIWDQRIKNDVLTLKLQNRMAALDEKTKKQETAPEKKTPEQRVLNRLKAFRIFHEENEPIYVLELYLSTLARLYDPHSSYMSPKTEDDFNIHMQLSFVGIGALLSAEDGYTKVESIFPGGPAEKSKMLKAADRIIAVREEGKEPLDVIDMPLTKVVEKIRGPKGTKVYLTILKGEEGTHAIPKEISIVRDTVEMKEAEASSEIKEITDSNGIKHKFGIITLPSFYMDFQGAMEGKKDYRSSTEDVKKILEDYNKQNIEGVIIDLRSNGGGSLKEAIELSGLFIKGSAVVQTKNSRGDVSVEEDSNDTPLYDGPLLVLVNKLSASASEIFAGAVQDYGRGIIVGDKSTHGKGTVQTVVELSKVLSRFNVGFNPGAIKLTNAKFYRVTGSSTQNRGIYPDISFNSLTDYMDVGEDSLENALPWDSINPVAFDKENDLKDTISSLRTASQKRQTENKDFQQLGKVIDLFKEYKDKKTVSLNEHKRWDEYQKEKKVLDDEKSIIASLAPERIPEAKNTDTARISDKGSKDEDEKDLFLNESLNILGDYVDMIKHYPAHEKKLAAN